MIYLATPYTHSDKSIEESRFEEACRIAGRLMAQGLVVFCPIAHTHPIAVRCDLPRGWDYWKKFDQEFIRASEKVVVAKMDSWQESRGVQAEIQIAQSLGIPVEFMEAGVSKCTCYNPYDIPRAAGQHDGICPLGRENIGNAAEAAQRAREDRGWDVLKRAEVAFAERYAEAVKIGWLSRDGKVVAPPSPGPYEFLNPDFLALMNDIGRLGHEKFGDDAIEANGDRTRKLPRHQANMLHAYRHITAYEDGVKHDKLGTLQAHLAAAAFNCMLEFWFSQHEQGE